jgi:replicative DNA helicase
MTVQALTPDASRSERVPQVNLEAEHELLGALIMRPASIAAVQAILLQEHFGEHLHGVIYEAILAAVEAGQAPSIAMVRQFLGARNYTADLGSGVTLSSYIASMMASAPGASNPAASARLIRDLWALRQIQAVGDDIGRMDTGFDPAAELGNRLGQVDAIRAAMLDRERMSATVGQAGREVVEWIETCLQGRATPLPKTGLPRLDEEIGGGLQPSSLVVGAARTSMGKSILGLEIADAVVRQGFGCVYHSLEMGRRQISARQIASRLEREGVRLPFADILKGRVPTSLTQRIPDIVADMRADPMWIEEAAGVTIGEIAATSERRMNAFARKGVKPGLVVIDHAHQVRPMRRDRNAEGDVREVSAGALALAKRLEVPVLLLAQCNRGTEGREDKRPGPADLRGSGALEEDADVLLFPYRPAYYVERSPDYRAGKIEALAEFEDAKHVLELIIDKNRAGRSNVVINAWIDPALNAIRDYAGADYGEVRR